MMMKFQFAIPIAVASALLLLPAQLSAQTLPDGPGKQEVIKLCSSCHELGRSVSLRQDRDAWNGTLRKMIAMGTKGTDQEFDAALDYLAKTYPAGEIPPVIVNKATAIEFESRLSLRRSQAAAIVAYRTRNGQFKSLKDLLKVPGIDTQKVLDKKDLLVF